MQNCFVRLLSLVLGVVFSVVEGSPSCAFPTLLSLLSCTGRVDALPASSGAFWGRRGCVGSAELEFISHRSHPRAVLPVGAGKEFLTHPCSGLGTAGTASALCLNIAHIQELGWARSQGGTQPGQLTQGDVPDPSSEQRLKEGTRGTHCLYLSARAATPCAEA